MASIPPRTSYTMSPHLRTPDGDHNRQSSLALVPITTKDSSPATGAFPSSRSPLSSIGNNNLGFGLRQRRQPQTFEGSSPFFNATETMKGPPRASLSMTMNMAGSGGGGVVTPKPDAAQNGMTGGHMVTTLQRGEHWILVFGFTSKSKREEVLRRFKAMGNVTDIKMASGTKNWVALCYDSELTAEKAASERDFQMTDGSFCGVRRLSNHQDFFLDQQRLYSSVLSQNVDGESVDEQVGLFSPPNTDNTKEQVVEIDEADILIAPNSGKGLKRSKTCCESFMGWIYGW